MTSAENENPSVTRFREYLRIKSVHPNPDYASCVEWLKKQADEIGLEFHIVDFEPPALFAVWLTWPGKNPQLKSVMLNSHIDVVPVDNSKWTFDPFGAEKDSAGNIYARGAQDMKSVGVQYLEAVRNLKTRGFLPSRNLHLTFVPDEEVGGAKGMGVFVKSKEFQNLNVGFALDEGLANPGESFNLYYGERAVWQVKFTARGQTGHASLLHDNTAAEKLRIVINEMLKLREKEKKRQKGENLELGHVTTINLTLLSGGIQPNVVPAELSAVFDIRITPMWKLEDVKRILDEICVAAGENVTFSFVERSDEMAMTNLNSENFWWVNFKSATDELGLKLNELIFPAGTDIQFLRGIGIAALGFSPMNNTPILLHDNDEFLNERIFLRGIEIYEKILEKIVSLTNEKCE